MAKTWILDTETKGTGANMVPLDKPKRRRDAAPELVFKAPPRRPRAQPEPEAKQPPRFRVVDVMTSQPLVDDADGRATVDALKGVRSIVDVRISRWDDEGERWRLLTAGEQRAIWDLRDR